MNTEVEQGSISTTFGCGLVGPKQILFILHNTQNIISTGCQVTSLEFNSVVLLR